MSPVGRCLFLVFRLTGHPLAYLCIIGNVPFADNYPRLKLAANSDASLHERNKGRVSDRPNHDVRYCINFPMVIRHSLRLHIQ
ncbi:hypothetical protein F5B20DRAFT_553559 [Whalleya microplaca]|nr:hypothetical protein F5B20DRAFT_553559 [Whalleya microplaca]